MTAKTTIDLFGQPTSLPSGRRGRPAHQWSQEVENAVIMGCALGWTTERIANGIGVSQPTLRKHYFQALKAKEIQRDRYELWKVAKLQDMANGGNVSAFRQLEDVFKRMDRARAAAELKAAQAQKEPPIGKKAAAKKAAAEAVEEGWGGLLTPGAYH